MKRLSELLHLLVLAGTCASLFAQRTPFHVNGAAVNNPNLSNSPSVTWSVAGSTVKGTASGSGGETIWTNADGTISANSTVADGASAVAFSLNSSNALSSNGSKLLLVQNDGTNRASLGKNGGLLLGNANGVYSDPNINGVGLNAVGAMSRGDQFVQIDLALLDYPLGSETNRADYYLDLGDPSSSFGPSSYFRYLDGVSGIDAKLQTAVGPNDIDVWFNYVGGAGVVAEIWPSSPDGGYIALFGSTITHTSGNLAEFKNNSTLESWLTHNGITSSTNGFASGATDTAVAIAATGWTNTFGKNAVVYVTGTNTTYTVFNNAGTAIYTNLTTIGVLDTSVILQPAGKVIISGTAVFGRATPF